VARYITKVSLKRLVGETLLPLQADFVIADLRSRGGGDADGGSFHGRHIL